MNDNIKQYTTYSLASIFPAGICALLSLASTDLKNLWYMDLSKPGFFPEDSVLIIGWAIALALFAAAMFVAFAHGGVGGRTLYIPFASLAITALWHYVFFNGDAVSGFYTLCLALPCGIYAGVCLYRRHWVAGLLAAPMAIWLGLLCLLNYMIFMMN